jgi:hypothetical protein
VTAASAADDSMELPARAMHAVVRMRVFNFVISVVLLRFQVEIRTAAADVLPEASLLPQPFVGSFGTFIRQLQSPRECA